MSAEMAVVEVAVAALKVDAFFVAHYAGSRWWKGEI